MSAHTVFCNIVRHLCGACGKWLSLCVTHNEPTIANRCTCRRPQP